VHIYDQYRDSGNCRRNNDYEIESEKNMSHWMLIVSLVIAGSGLVYLRQIIFFIKGLSKIGDGNNGKQYRATVLVSARNEEAHIERCLRALLDQNYPQDKYSIVVIDDQSVDATPAILHRLSKEISRLRVLRVKDCPPEISPKINALTLGIAGTSSEIILTTDADCIVGEEWISSIMRYFEDGIGVVSGTTLFSRVQTVGRFLYGFQFIDFLSHTACGAGSIGMGYVNNCNGSNMAFRRSAFLEAGGYSEIAHVNSGSDSLLAQRIVTRTQWKMKFAADPKTQVVTIPVSSWRGLLFQRMRWAAQTTYYRPSTLLFLSASFVMYGLLFLFVPVSIIYWPVMPVPVIMFLLKCGVDYWILKKFVRLTRTPSVMKYFVPAELAHIPIILGAVAGGFFGKFEWKGRMLERELPRTSQPEVATNGQ
jgi:cellulose synthase/poly-beta-1,6-N-acetylglucosamine synthase-like glycosyltransferase